jgi:hypothetical protein
MEVENSSAAAAAPAPDDDLEEGELSSDSNDDNETDNKTGDDAASPPHVNIIFISSHHSKYTKMTKNIDIMMYFVACRRLRTDCKTHEAVKTTTTFCGWWWWWSVMFQFHIQAPQG